jgi:hypothetical protein
MTSNNRATHHQTMSQTTSQATKKKNSQQAARLRKIRKTMRQQRFRFSKNSKEKTCDEPRISKTK